MALGCSDKILPTGQGWELVGKQGSHAVVDPTGFMTAVGCRVQEGADSSGSIAVKLVNAEGTSRFRCNGVPQDSLKRAVGLYRQAARDSVGGSHMQSGGGDGGGDGGDGEVWVLIHWECHYNVTETTVRWDDGTYRRTDVTRDFDGCEFSYTILPGGSTPPPPIPVYIQDVAVTASATTISIGEDVTLTATGTWSNTTQADITNTADYSLGEDHFGTMSGPVFHATSAGAQTITAFYTDGDSTRSGSVTITVQELPDSLTTDDLQNPCAKDYTVDCVGSVATHSEMNAIRSAIGGIVATGSGDPPYCSQVKAILLGLDSTQYYNAGSPPNSTMLAQNGAWTASAEPDSVVRAQNMVIQLYSGVWNGNKEHSFAETLVHEVLHVLTNTVGGGQSRADEKHLDFMANKCVLNHH